MVRTERVPKVFVYVWKTEHLFKACFIYPDKLRSYVVLNDRSPNKEMINNRLNNLVKGGYKIIVGLPPDPSNIKIVKEIIDPDKAKK